MTAVGLHSVSGRGRRSASTSAARRCGPASSRRTAPSSPRPGPRPLALSARTEAVLVDVVEKLRAEHEVAAVGLAVAGFVSSDRSRVMFAPHLAWRGDPVPARLSERLGLPVVMEHDVNAAAWAEYCRGRIGRGFGRAAGRGRHGHRRRTGPRRPGVPGCLRRRAGTRAHHRGARRAVLSVREARAAGSVTAPAPRWHRRRGSCGRRAGRPPLSDLAGGDPHCPHRNHGGPGGPARETRSRWKPCPTWVGGWASGWPSPRDVLDPAVVVIGGGVSGAADLFLASTRTVLSGLITGRQHRPQPQLALARFGDAASVVGAALLAAASVAE